MSSAPSSSGTRYLADLQNNVKDDLVNGEYSGNGYPYKYTAARPRFNLHTKVVGTGKDEKLEATFIKSQCKMCIICKRAGVNLLSCEGFRNGEEKCMSQFHLECIKTYNDGEFFFQYAALPECQNRLLCSLHCCYSCNKSGHRQSAYYGKLVECHRCLRSYHKDTCIPCGSKEWEVLWKDEMMEESMLECPTHFEQKETKAPEKMKKFACDITHCHYCGESEEEDELTKCKKCPRVYHQNCVFVKRIDGEMADKNQCDVCRENGVIRQNTPVLAKFNLHFWLGITRKWDDYPHKIDHKSGMIVVEWLDKKGKGQKSIVPLNQVVHLTTKYLKMARGEEERKQWEDAVAKFKSREEFPVIYKKVTKDLKKAKFYKVPEEPVHKIKMDKNCGCSDDCSNNCAYGSRNLECPPSCRKFRNCVNRFVSKGKCSKKIRLVKTDTKGYGVKAIKDIGDGEKLAEYSGEIISAAERAKRLSLIDMADDLEPNRYLMDIDTRWSIDSARKGNITRYINHSCDANTEALHIKVIQSGSFKLRKNVLPYRPAVIIRARRSIKAGEEITLYYKMNNLMEICLCKSINCSGKKKRAKSDEKDEDDKDQPSTSRRQPTSGKRKKRPVKEEEVDDEENHNQLSTTQRPGKRQCKPRKFF
ncbi:hypothetical protein GCK72_012035 [Caenorhabditis remanei]|uniref:SET domain-containing protein n=1 Tax=Caenorhabditis remanei TaxID=31234 RepID=A0A6A5GM17_CAERE|nr:hypothetical protein GCK72_012035 [Caenorhabditis remanei]KAF1755585.1 hypothetical protein GCK72_012035 [Caenorhabditis remanei]